MATRFLTLVAALLSFPAFAQLAVTDAWVRGTVPGQMGTGAFMQIKSTSDAKLVAAASPAAKVVQIHEMKMDGGTMKMREVDQIALPAGKAVELKPGGYHVMMMDLTQPLKEGDQVPLTLTVVDKDGKKVAVQVTATVRGLTSGAMKH